MQTAIVLAAFATLTQAGLTPILSPTVARDVLQNGTMNTSTRRNTTLIDDQPAREYSTVEYRAYVAFLVLGIVLAVVFPPLVLSRDIGRLYRERKDSKKVKQRNFDVEMAHSKMRAMTEPAVVYLRPERAG